MKEYTKKDFQKKNSIKFKSKQEVVEKHGGNKDSNPSDE